ncbi:MAG: lipocalin-like domain-containing protein [Acidobacteriota bacterium]
MTRRSVAAALALLVPPALLGEEWRRVTEPPRLEFPADRGPHPAFLTEWWYATGRLTAEDGSRVGYQLVFFRRGVDPGPPQPGQSALRPRQVLAAHLAIADLESGRFHTAQRARRVAAGLAGWREGGLDLWLEDWSITLDGDGTLRLSAAERAAGLSLDVALRPGGPPVLHGDRGLSAKGPEPGNASAYLSWPRLESEAALTVTGVARTMRGTSWFDHEWGSSALGEGIAGWDWFGLRLADGRDLMLFMLRRADGSIAAHSAGTLVGADGSVIRLGAGDFTASPLSTWTSPATGARYPSRWRLRVPAAALELEITPALQECEVDGRTSTGTVYWEGPVDVAGTVAGEGYMELTGYAGTMAGRF